LSHKRGRALYPDTLSDGMLLRDINIRLEFARFLKFAVVGIVGVVVNTVALYLLTTFVFGERLYLAAAAISLELSILNNFYLNEYWTFRDKTAAGGVSNVSSNSTAHASSGPPQHFLSYTF
jgi:putative flippase GtrA